MIRWYLDDSLSGDAIPLFAEIDEKQLDHIYMKEEMNLYFKSFVEEKESIDLRKVNYSKIRARIEADIRSEYVNKFSLEIFLSLSYT